MKRNVEISPDRFVEPLLSPQSAQLAPTCSFQTLMLCEKAFISFPYEAVRWDTKYLGYFVRQFFTVSSGEQMNSVECYFGDFTLIEC